MDRKKILILSTDYGWNILREGSPDSPFLVFDMRPFLGLPLAVVYTHDIAEQCSKPSKGFRYSLYKSPTLGSLTDVIGHESILGKEGEEWRALRKRFNPGFAPSHLLTLLPIVVKMTGRFLRNLDGFVKSGEVFVLEKLCTSLTFDIIGAVVLDVDFCAQMDEQKHPIVVAYGDLIEQYDDKRTRGVWGRLTTRSRKRSGGRKVDREIKKVVKSHWELPKAEKSGRSVLALSLQDLDVLTPYLLQETADSVKTFLFAGHDTTSTLLQWAFYELAIHPRVLATLTAELDHVFGKGTSSEEVSEQLLQRGEEVLKQLSYTSAIIKETLRLYPPAGSARIAPKGSGFTVHDADTGADLPMDGVVVYLNHWAIQRDPKVYGESANRFNPDRWLGNTDTSMETEGAANTGEGGAEKGIPTSAWRPFERGPRNCIGQELANLEARIILACAVRRYTFEKVGVGAVKLDEKGNASLDAHGDVVVEQEMYNRRNVTSKPVDGMRMRVRFTETGS